MRGRGEGREATDRVVGRRSVLVDGAEPLLAPGEREDSEETAWADELVFADSLRIASGLEPEWFWADTFGADEFRTRLDNGWLFEVANVVGMHQVAGAQQNGESYIVGYGEVNHKFPDQLLEQGYIDEYSPRQLPENRRYVSVRVDMMRLSDGKSMCLGEHDVGVKWHTEWPGQGPFAEEDEAEHIHLTPSECCSYEESILPQPRPKGENDVLALRSSVLADYPQETPGALDLVAVSLGFGCPEPEPELDRDETHFDGTGRTHDMVVKSLLTLDAWT